MTLAFEMPPKEGKNSNPSRRLSLWRKLMAASIGNAIVNEVAETERSEQVSSLIDDLLEQFSLNQESLPKELLSIFTKTETINKFVCGDYKYPLREEIDVYYVKDYKTVVVQLLQRIDLRGHGTCFDTALNDLSTKLHLRYCHIESIPSIQRTSQQREEWDILESLIDTEKSRAISPREANKIGQVVSRIPFEIQWMGETHHQKINPELIPKSLAGLEEGSWFSAVVLEVNQEFQKILSSRRIVPPSPKERKTKPSRIQPVDLDEIL